MVVKYYVALSQDGHEVAIFNSSKLEISTCTIDTLNELKPFFYKPFKEANAVSFSHVTWSLSISNKLANGEILIALSCFNKNVHLMSGDKDSKQRNASLTRQSINSVLTHTTTSDSLGDLESGGKKKNHHSTWIFSTLNKERIRTTLDDLGGIIRVLGSSSHKQNIIIIHHYGITKANIPINYRIFQSPFHYNTLNKRVFKALFGKNSNNATEFYFPSVILNQISHEDNPQLNLFYRNIKKNYLFVQDYKLDKLNTLECYNLRGSNCGELVKLFKINSTKYNPKELPFIVANRTSKNNIIIEISKNEKLLAYHNRHYNNIITLFLMENCLEICTKEFTDIHSIIHIQFICNDEKLLIIGEQKIEDYEIEEIEIVKTYNEGSIRSVFVVWDLFSSNSEEDSVKITYDSLNMLDVFRHHHSYASSNGNIIYMNPEDGTVNSLFDHPDLINVLRTPSNILLKPIDTIMAQELVGSTKNYYPIYHFDKMLDANTLEKEVNYGEYIEPWIRSESIPQILVFINGDMTLRVVIGHYSIQVWRNKPLKTHPSLEYIWISNHQKIEVKSLLVGKNEFLLKFTLCSENSSNDMDEEIIQIHWPHVLILKDACVALEYYFHSDGRKNPKKGIFFDEFQAHIKKIVKKFIIDEPIIFQLAEIRYDIMGNLIRGNCVSIIKKILFTNRNKLSKSSEANLRAMNAKTNNHLHLPRLYSWDSNSLKKSDLEVAIESSTGVHRKDTIIVGYLLDYYSDNAIISVGWMNTISRALPHLYNHHLDYYVRELFYKPCFGKKQSSINQSLISSYELEKGFHKDVHAIYIRQELQRKPNTKYVSNFTDKLVNSVRKLKQNVFHNGDFIPNIRYNVVVSFHIVLYYLGYLRLSVEYLQLKQKGLVISLRILNPNENELILRSYTVATSLITFIMWIELLLLLRFFSGPANYINISISIISRVFYFFIFMTIVIVAIAHSMYLLLRSPDLIHLVPNGQSFTSVNLNPDITINQTFDVNNVSDNYFSNFWQSIVAVYFWINGRWDQVDQWNFLPIEILCFVASILLITVMQNMLVAFMTSVFDDASTSGRQAVLKFRADLICDYETLIKVIVSRNNDIENPRKLYYVAKLEAVENWESEAKKYRKLHKSILVDRFESVTDDEKSDDEYGEIWERFSKEIKGKKKRDYSGSSYDGSSSKFNSIRGYKSFENNDVEKLEKKMKEVQDDVKNKMKEIKDEMKSNIKGLEDKLVQLLELFKT
ncbi:hypothetical protein C1645_808118 [Glomus cerebriforme]|uniref:Ion transport domain-containing protein n=1 Tax=Glomus cerebriforme TaxID=658196 RepID=A0A397SHJ3_9GLOM|nr:hypothetical protein C1645_808118 [Glomus cerebriforme]